MAVKAVVRRDSFRTAVPYVRYSFDVGELKLVTKDVMHDALRCFVSEMKIAWNECVIG